MTTVELLKKAAAKNKGIVVLPVAEYRRLIEKDVPEYHLAGTAAHGLDRLVERGLRDYAAGKCITAGSLDEALAIRGKRDRRAEQHAR